MDVATIFDVDMFCHLSDFCMLGLSVVASGLGCDPWATN